MDDVRRRLSQDFVPTVKTGLCYWPIVGMFNAAFVPVMNRPAFSSFAGVFWNVYISYQANYHGMEVGEVSIVYPLPAAESVRATRRSSEEAAVVSGGKVIEKSTSSFGKDGNAAKERTGSKIGTIVRRTSVVSI